MKAVIIATGYAPDIKGLTKSVSAEMLPLLDRPFLQHIVESLINRNISGIDFIINEHAHVIEELFSSGKRWGSEFKYHLCKDPQRPFELLKNIIKVNPTGCLIVCGNRLSLSAMDYSETFNDKELCVTVWKNGDKEVFAGIAKVTAELCNSANRDTTVEEFQSLLLSLDESEKIFVEEPLFIDSYKNYLRSTSRAMIADSNKLIVSGKVKDESIWISRNVILHPTVRLISPVYLGKNCRISEGCLLGPDVVISDGTIIDNKTSIKNSIVLDKSYVGEGLELEDVIIDKSLLVNAKHNSILNVPDPYILGNLSDQSFKHAVYNSLVKIFAFCLLTITLPILICTAIFLKFRGVKNLFIYDEVVTLPTVDDILMWKTIKIPRFNIELPKHGRHRGTRRRREFFYCTIPGMLGVLYENLHIVGLAGRTIGSIEIMEDDWRELYLKGKIGVISEASVIYDNEPNCDELFTAEAFYSVKKSFKHDLKLFFTYIGKLFIL